jgi:membrane-associated phospholipid phosphatase
VALALGAPLAHGQPAPKRLSDWLLEQPPSPAPYPAGLSWRVPGEVPAQTALRFELLNLLAAGSGAVTADPGAAARLREWLGALPVTGRVPVAAADPRWLQANPDRDPILLPGHTAVLPQRPRTVTVVTAAGELCAVAHVQGHEARAYLSACDATGAARADWAWIAQPDGRVRRYGIALWNREQQDEPAPGAWIWAPPRDGGWPERFSQRLIEFLATQGPAPDPAPTTPALRATPPRAGGEETAPSALSPRSSVLGPESSAPDCRLPTADCRLGSRPSVLGPESSVLSPGSLPSGAPARSRGREITANDWGNAGLLQTPSARMREAGYLGFNLSRTQPYTHGNIFAQPFDWLEAGFRYTDISNRPYGPPERSGGQSAKDKGFDVKFLLWPESAHWPQVAVGFRDVAGTGLFSGEYVVANKRTGDFDWSLGVGWGYLAGGARRSASPQGGQFQFDNYFSGRARPFGGVQWHTPWEKWLVKLEYDANDYQNEPLANNQRRGSPWNVGLVYRWSRSTDFTLGYERGNQVTIGFALHTQLDGLTTPKLNDPPRLPVAATRPQHPPEWKATAHAIRQQADWEVLAIARSGRELRVVFEDASAVYWRERVDRVVAVLHRDAPADVDRFVLTYRRRGDPVAEHVVDRDTWVAQQVTPLPPSERREPVIARAPEPRAAEEAGEVVYAGTPSLLDSAFSIGYGQVLGGPDAFILFQFYAQQNARLRLRDDTWVNANLRLRLLDNFDRFRITGPSNLPRVRTYLREYQTTSALTLANLQLTHTGKLGANDFYSVYGGYLEEMFAGAGAEWLHRPFASRIAWGVDVNWVKQREFEQKFGFLKPAYSTATGHGTLYWDTGWNDVQVKVSAGRYLAGDKGVTLDLSRTFRNGVVLGAFATRTDVSAEQFGEGSFDKGVYVIIPFDAMLTRTTNALATLLWRPLTRDGGAMLFRRDRLHDLTRARSDRTLQVGPAGLPHGSAVPPPERASRADGEKAPEPYTRVTARPTAQQWRTDGTHEFRLTEALYRQSFRNIRVSYDGASRLTVRLSNEGLRPVGRAVGRAARVAAQLAPEDAREIRIVFAERADPGVIYEFFDLERLRGYFGGEIGRAELEPYVRVEYLNPAMREPDPLARLDDVDTAPPGLVDLVPTITPPARVMEDLSAAARAAADVNWLRAGAVGLGTVLVAGALDERIDRRVARHAGSGAQKNLTRVGDALPWIGLAGSAATALLSGDPASSRTGYAAAEAGVTGILAATALKYGVGRARPGAGAGRGDFEPLSGKDGRQSFPSRHTTAAWAIATPFALEYNAPWLYGVAALTGLGRVTGREHWFSDAVAGGVLGYGIGRLFWESSRPGSRSATQVSLTPSGIYVTREW